MANPKEIVVELFLYNDSLLTGVVHYTFKGGLYLHSKLSGKYRKEDSSLIFTEDSVISVRKERADIVCIGKLDLKLSFPEDKLLLSGKWSDKKKGLFSCPSTKIWLERKIDSASNAGGSSTDSNATNNKYQDVSQKRVSDIQKVIEIKDIEKDSIKIELFDNGEIDDDTVTVFFDDQILKTKERISTKPVTLFISLHGVNETHKVKLVADNLGKIPPNTALMVITTKSKRYEIFLTSSNEKNAVVEFFIVQ
jgi:hypothetical protein